MHHSRIALVALATLAAVAPCLLGACSPRVVSGPGAAEGQASQPGASDQATAGQKTAWPTVSDASPGDSSSGTWPRDSAPIQAAVEAALAGHSGSAYVAYESVDGSTTGFSLGGEERVPSASMIKTVVMATLLQEAQDGRISLADGTILRGQDRVAGSGVVQGMRAGTWLSYGQLAAYMIGQSDNMATNLLIDALGMDAVNEECQRLGLADTSLRRKMMDTAAATSGRENYTSASDQARLLLMVARGELVSPEASERALGWLEDQADTRGLAQGLPDGVAFAHKTGSLDGVRHDGGIVLGDHPYVLVVMTTGMDQGQADALMARVSTAVWEAVREP